MSSNMFPQECKPSNFWTGRGSYNHQQQGGNTSMYYINQISPYASTPVPSISYQPPIGQLEGKCPVGPARSGFFSRR